MPNAEVSQSAERHRYDTAFALILVGWIPGVPLTVATLVARRDAGSGLDQVLGYLAAALALVCLPLGCVGLIWGTGALLLRREARTWWRIGIVAVTLALVVLMALAV